MQWLRLILTCLLSTMSALWASPAAPPLFSSPQRGAPGTTAAAATTGDGGKAETVDAAAARLAPYLAAALAAAGCWPSAA